MTESNSPHGAAEPNTTQPVSPTQVGQAHEATFAITASPPKSPASDSHLFRLAVGGRLDTYELVEKLGEGGMGSVWMARHVKLDKIVALKVLPMHLTQDPEAVRRFEREMRAVGKLEHPHVVRAMDAGEVAGLHFLVMEYVEGTDLSKYIQARGPQSVADACVMVRHAALGLAAAHAQGLIHRDIKPSNLLLSKQGQVKVLDLGLARLLADGPETGQLTQSGQVLGTPDYMAPEQWDNTHTVDHRADLYALGCTLCFLLTGRAPFGDDRHSTMGLKMKGHMLDTPPRLRDVRPEVPEDLEELYAELMVKEPEQRLASASEVANRLNVIAQCCAAKTTSTLRADKVAAGGPIALGGTAMPTVATPTVSYASESDTIAAPATQVESCVQLRTTKSATSPLRRRSPLWLAAAGGAAVMLVLFGVIVIKIVNKDGTTTEIRVPEGASVELQKDGKVVANLDDQQEVQSSSMTSRPSASPTGSAPPLAVVPFDAAKAREHQEVWAKHLGVPVEFTNSIGMKFRLIPPGEFTMGITEEEVEAIAALHPSDEFARRMLLSSAPRHKARLTQAFYLGTHEVTQEQYEKIVGFNPSHFSASGASQAQVKNEDTQHHPVETVSFIDAAEFCIKLGKQENLKPVYSYVNGVITLLPGEGYRLPTEAEWEYACRAGTNTAWFHGEEEKTLGTAAWLVGNSGNRTHAVGQLKSNPFGLYDVHGNVWEWCQDWYDPQAYTKRGPSPTEDPKGPQGPNSSLDRVLRGGSWANLSFSGRSAFRHYFQDWVRHPANGFRVLVGVSGAHSSR